MDVKPFGDFFNSYFGDGRQATEGAGSSQNSGNYDTESQHNQYHNPYDYSHFEYPRIQGSEYVNYDNYQNYDCQASSSYAVGGESSTDDEQYGGEESIQYSLNSRPAEDTLTIRSELIDMLKKSGNEYNSDSLIENALFEKSFSPYDQSMSANEFVTLSLYSGQMNQEINARLWENPSYSCPVVEAMKGGLKKLAQDPDNVESEHFLYRGANYRFTQSEVEKEFPIGGIYCPPAFLSTSTSKKIADTFTKNLQMRFDAKTAVKHKISVLSKTSNDEKEAIILPNTAFRVLNVEKKKKIWYVDLKEV
jgi:NAD:arginine ADP-ribosyltransferase